MEELEKLKLARLTVAPVWGLGLKSIPVPYGAGISRRPRMGAWIEIENLRLAPIALLSPPYGGVD